MWHDEVHEVHFLEYSIKMDLLWINCLSCMEFDKPTFLLDVCVCVSFLIGNMLTRGTLLLWDSQFLSSSLRFVV